MPKRRKPARPPRTPGAVLHFNFGRHRYALRAPWHPPLFSERKHGAILSIGGWRITRRVLEPQTIAA